MNGTPSCSHTFEQVKAAKEEGKLIFAKAVSQTEYKEEEALFTKARWIVNPQTNTESVSFEDNRLSVHDGTINSLTCVVFVLSSDGLHVEFGYKVI